MVLDGSAQEMVKFTLNGEPRELNVPSANPLLWVLRESLELTGTKLGCGIGHCGACMVLVDGQPIKSCQVPVSVADGTEVITIEGLAERGLHPVQEAWVEEQVPDCRYCQHGRIICAVGLLGENLNPTDEDIDNAMSGSVRCCGICDATRRAIHRAAEVQAQIASRDSANRRGKN